MLRAWPSSARAPTREQAQRDYQAQEVDLGKDPEAILGMRLAVEARDLLVGPPAVAMAAVVEVDLHLDLQELDLVFEVARHPDREVDGEA